jgi:hypothetical protein
MNDKRKRKWDQPAAGAPQGQAGGSIPAGGGLPPDLLAQAQAAAIAAAQKLTAVSVCCVQTCSRQPRTQARQQCM